MYIHQQAIKSLLLVLQGIKYWNIIYTFTCMIIILLYFPPTAVLMIELSSKFDDIMKRKFKQWTTPQISTKQTTKKQQSQIIEHKQDHNMMLEI
jgi:hypothetical protein